MAIDRQSLARRYRAFYASRSGYAVFWSTVYLLVIGAASLLFIYQIPLPPDRLILSQVEAVPDDADRPDRIRASAWDTVQLPDDWRQRNSSRSNIWYRGHMQLNVQPGRLWAVLIPALRMNAAVYLNGVLLGNGGRFEDPVARNWMTPQIHFIPHGLLRSGDNLVHIRVKSDPPGSGQLSQLVFAPYKELLDAYNTHYMLRITSIEMITVMLSMMGLLIGILWWVRREESYYGLYALAVLVWALHNLNIFVTEIPFSTRLWDWAAFMSIGLYALTTVFFIHRFLHISRPTIERLLSVFVITAGLALLLLDGTTFYTAVYNAWYPAIFGIGLYSFGVNLAAAWRHRSTDLQLLAASGLVIMLYATHDLLLMHGLADWQDGYFIQYGAACLMTLFSAILARRFAYSMNSLDSLNRDLEQRIEEKRIQIERSFQRIHSMEKEQAIAIERERLSRDIHDGLGGHLVSTLAMIETGNADLHDVSDAIRDSLNDLRLMVDSMEMQEDDLPTMLGMFRMRIGHQLRAGNISLGWEVNDLPPIPGFGPREALHILRILQEAVSNAIRHGKASRIDISARHDQIDNKARIQIRDNGNGFTETKSPGHGLKNMRQRAELIGASLLLTQDAGGTTIEITIPLPGSEDQPDPGDRQGSDTKRR